LPSASTAPGSAAATGSGDAGGEGSAHASSTEHIRGSSLLLAGRFVALALALVTETLLVRLLSKPDYGSLAFALSVVAIASTTAALGLDKSAARFVPIYDEQGRTDRVAGSVAMMTLAMLIAGLALTAGLIAFGDRLPPELVGSGPALQLLLTLAALIPLSALGSLAVTLLTVFLPARAILVQRYLLGPGVKLIVIAVALLIARDVQAVAIAYVVSGAAALVIYSWSLVRVLRRRGLFGSIGSRGIADTAREIFPFTLPLMSTDVVFVLRTSLLIVALQGLSGSIAAAEYRAVVPIAQQNMVVLETFAFLFTPLAARLFARGDQDGVHDLYWRSAIWIALITYPVFLASFALAGPVTVFLFGDEYASSGPILAVLGLGFYLNSALGFNGFTLRVYGRVRYLVAVEVISAIVGVVLGFFLIREAGAIGAAISFLISMVVQNLFYQVGLGRIGLLRRSDARLIPTYVLIGVSAVGLAVVQATTAMPLPLGIAAALALWAGLVYLNRRRLDIGAMFPELAMTDPRRWLRR
jgi:O-antigen/teichoic acid export membrane protein